MLWALKVSDFLIGFPFFPYSLSKTKKGGDSYLDIYKLYIFSQQLKWLRLTLPHCAWVRHPLNTLKVQFYVWISTSQWKCAYIRFECLRSCTSTWCLQMKVVMRIVKIFLEHWYHPMKHKAWDALLMSLLIYWLRRDAVGNLSGWAKVVSYRRYSSRIDSMSSACCSILLSFT